MYKRDGYAFMTPSKRRFKKYDAYRDGQYIASFGDVRYGQFRDKIGHYSGQDHNDLSRQKAYFNRHGLKAVFESPKWFAHKYLWS
jgi:hypothetical protein